MYSQFLILKTKLKMAYQLLQKIVYNNQRRWFAIVIYEN